MGSCKWNLCVCTDECWFAARTLSALSNVRSRFLRSASRRLDHLMSRAQLSRMVCVSFRREQRCFRAVRLTLRQCAAAPMQRLPSDQSLRWARGQAESLAASDGRMPKFGRWLVSAWSAVTASHTSLMTNARVAPRCTTGTCYHDRMTEDASMRSPVLALRSRVRTAVAVKASSQVSWQRHERHRATRM